MKKIIVIVVLTVLIVFTILTYNNTNTITYNNCVWIFSTSKPDINDPNILLCVPAAYTDDSGKIIGHYSEGTVRKGESNYDYTTIHLDKGYFQQLTLVKNKTPKIINDSKLRFRRALCKKGNKYYIENSKYPITLSNFAKNLSKVYDNAWNLDMGTFAFGWYKKNNKIYYLSKFYKLNQHKQSNWIIVLRK